MEEPSKEKRRGFGLLPFALFFGAIAYALLCLRDEP